MTTYLVGRLRCRWPSALRAGGQAVISGGAASAALEIAAVASCADQGDPSRPASFVSGTRPSGSLKHQERAILQTGRSAPRQSLRQSSVRERAPTRPNCSQSSEIQFSVSTNLPNRLPVLTYEIALIGAALSEFLAPSTSTNDNEGDE